MSVLCPSGSVSVKAPCHTTSSSAIWQRKVKAIYWIKYEPCLQSVKKIWCLEWTFIATNIEFALTILVLTKTNLFCLWKPCFGEGSFSPWNGKLESNIRHEDFRLSVRVSRSGYPPWILKRGGLESSGRIASSKYWIFWTFLNFCICWNFFWFFVGFFGIFFEKKVNFWGFSGFLDFLTSFNFFYFWGFLWIFWTFLDFSWFFGFFLDFFWIILFFLIFWFLNFYQCYYWTPKIAKNGPKQHNNPFFLPERQKKPWLKAEALRRS